MKKKLTLLAVACALVAIAATVKISQLIVTTAIYDTNTFAIAANGVTNYQLSYGSLRTNLATNLPSTQIRGSLAISPFGDNPIIFDGTNGTINGGSDEYIIGPGTMTLALAGPPGFKILNLDLNPTNAQWAADGNGNTTNAGRLDVSGSINAAGAVTVDGRNFVFPPNATRLVFEGDSLSQGLSTNAPYPLWLTNAFFTNSLVSWGTNAANSGETTTTMLGEYTNEVQRFKPAGGTNAILFFWAGVVDVYYGSNTAATIVANISNEWFLARQDGFQVCAMTITDSGIPSHEKLRRVVNEQILSATNQYDYLVDLSAMYPNNDLAVTYDGLHFNYKNNRRIAEAVFNALTTRAQPTAVSQQSIYDFLTVSNLTNVSLTANSTMVASGNKEIVSLPNPQWPWGIGSTHLFTGTQTVWQAVSPWHWLIQDEFVGDPTVANSRGREPWNVSNVGGGLQQQKNAEPGAAGIMEQVVTNAANIASLLSLGALPLQPTNMEVLVMMRVRQRQSNDGTDVYGVRLGLMNTGSIEPNHGMYWRDTNNSWVAVTRRSGTETATTCSNRVADAWTILGIYLDSTGTNCIFGMGGTENTVTTQCTNTLNIPGDQLLLTDLAVYKLAGTTTRMTNDIDWIKVGVRYTP